MRPRGQRWCAPLSSSFPQLLHPPVTLHPCPPSCPQRKFGALSFCHCYSSKKVTKERISYLFYAIISLIKYEVFYSNIEKTSCKRKTHTHTHFKTPKPSIHLSKFIGKAEVGWWTPVLGGHPGLIQYCVWETESKQGKSNPNGIFPPESVLHSLDPCIPAHRSIHLLS